MALTPDQLAQMQLDLARQTIELGRQQANAAWMSAWAAVAQAVGAG